jgi:hypothetical protein
MSMGWTISRRAMIATLGGAAGVLTFGAGNGGTAGPARAAEPRSD